MHYVRVVAGYHGCDASVADKLLAGDESFVKSTNEYDWLGEGVYFWEYGLQRALDWAQEAVARDAARPPGHRPPVMAPAVIGAWIQLGHCFDLLDTEATRALSEFYPKWKYALETRGEKLPQNRRNYLLRNRDCAVINTYLTVFAGLTGKPYDTVRGCFIEGEEVYEGSAFTTKAHIQVAVRQPACILGVFRPTMRKL